MKKLVLAITATLIFVFVLATANITADAASNDWSSYYDKAKAKRAQREKEFTEKWLDELEADGNLTPEAIKAAGKYGEGRVPNQKSTQSSGSTSTGGNSGSTYSGPGKGWVYSVDELHVIGLPEGENGYTQPGWYGNID